MMKEAGKKRLYSRLEDFVKLPFLSPEDVSFKDHNVVLYSRNCVYYKSKGCELWKRDYWRFRTFMQV